MPIEDDLPDPDRLTLDDLKLVRNLFQDVATAAARRHDRVMTDWARVIADRYAHTINERTASRRTIQGYIDEKRRDRPHGTPGDTTDLPPWSEISGSPDDET